MRFAQGFFAGLALFAAASVSVAHASSTPTTARQTVKQPREAQPTTPAVRPATQAPRRQVKPEAGSQRNLLRPVSLGASPRALTPPGGISCVPYARAATGMQISGDGRQWWHNAAGQYARGQRPETGSVLAFPGSGGMWRGHVAVVERVVSEREILIHHANWGGPGIRRGTVMRGVRVIDVSDANDWTAVRVQVGYDRSNFGRTYRTYGFIYNRPEQARFQMVDWSPTIIRR